MLYYFCAPTNTHQLKVYAENIRKMFECESLKFPIIDVLESMQSNEKYLNFEFQILDDDDRIFEDGELAKYSFETNTLFIKESQFDGACNDDPRCRFTLTHELCHFFLMTVTGRHPKESEEKPAAFKDPEWQANALAGYILVPPIETKDMSIEEIEEKCCVSPECATYAKIKRLKELKKEEGSRNEHQ